MLNKPNTADSHAMYIEEYPNIVVDLETDLIEDDHDDDDDETMQMMQEATAVFVRESQWPAFAEEETIIAETRDFADSTILFADVIVPEDDYYSQHGRVSSDFYSMSTTPRQEEESYQDDQEQHNDLKLPNKDDSNNGATLEATTTNAYCCREYMHLCPAVVVGAVSFLVLFAIGNIGRDCGGMGGENNNNNNKGGSPRSGNIHDSPSDRVRNYCRQRWSHRGHYHHYHHRRPCWSGGSWT